MRQIVAWWLFAPGAFLITASIIALRIDGLTVTGAVFLVGWAWLLGVFTSEFWAAEVPRGVSPYHEARKFDELDPTAHLSTLDRADGIGNRKESE